MRRASVSSGCQDFAFGERQQFAGIVHVAGMLAETLDAPGQLASSSVEGGEAQGRPALALAIAFAERSSDVAPEASEARQARKADQFAQRDHQGRESGNEQQREGGRADPIVAR